MKNRPSQKKSSRLRPFAEASVGRKPNPATQQRKTAKSSADTLCRTTSRSCWPSSRTFMDIELFVGGVRAWPRAFVSGVEPLVANPARSCSHWRTTRRRPTWRIGRYYRKQTGLRHAPSIKPRMPSAASANVDGSGTLATRNPKPMIGSDWKSSLDTRGPADPNKYCPSG
jgi:hypothetical protein